MELRQLEYFIAVCKELHFTKAAEKLGISQPTLSLQIKALENELNTPLFDRIGKRIALTEAGSLLLEQSVQILRHLQNAKDSINDLHNNEGGTLTVGALPSDLDYRISNLLIDYHTELPKIRLIVISSVEIPNLVLENEVDIGIGITPIPDDRLEWVPLCREEYTLVVSERHAWAERASVPLNDLMDLQTVMFPKGFIGRELVDDCCRKNGFTVKTILETSTVTSLINLVKANIGATVQPYALIKSMNEPTLRCIQITGGAPYREIGVIHRKDRFLGQAAKAFIQKTVAHFRTGG
ncbi:LysR family transcriptional regulator [Paenibacillus sp. sptzw28]|uniref:LysR family transcriptional regulator n=1 Tax=Paenibacillus sp. sptzw28 TaxID=715179 RepID=UPI001C6F3755|nr:LysR family transcriptional regulator [Paenibacillus sp. sptzw28]QYR21846.1 LysR family transcriptional regulator [Paenibacillus sp. sptzw28]